MREFNIGLSTAVEFLASKGHKVESNPSAALTSEQYGLLQKEYSSSAALKKEAEGRHVGRSSSDNIVINASGMVREPRKADEAEIAPSAVRSAAFGNPEPRRDASRPAAAQPPVAERVERPAAQGLNILGKIDLDAKQPVAPAKPAEPAAQEAPVAATAPVAPATPAATTTATPSPAATPVAEKAPEAIAAQVAPIAATTPVATATPSETTTAATPSPAATPVAEKAPEASAPAAQAAPVAAKAPVAPAAPAAAKPVAEKAPEASAPTTKPVASSNQPANQTPRPPAPQGQQRPQGGGQPNQGGQGGDRRNNNQSGGPQGNNQGGGRNGGQNQSQNNKVQPRDNNRPIEARTTIPTAAAPASSLVPQQQAAPNPDQAPDIPVELIKAEAEQLKGLTVLGKIELPMAGGRNGKPGQGGAPGKPGEKRKRARLKPGAPGGNPNNNGAVRIDDTTRGNRPGGGPGGPNRGPGGPGGPGGNRPGGPNRGPGGGYNNNRPGANSAPLSPEATDKQIQEQIKATLARLSGSRSTPGGNRAKYRRDKRNEFNSSRDEQARADQAEAQILKVTEFISVADLASLMDVSVNEVIKACLSAGMFVSINQRLDAKTIEIIALEFDFEVQFTTAKEEEIIIETVDNEEDLLPRAPIVTIMGHVDHGKTSLLDYIRNTRVVAGEAGGITQHIGAYDVTTASGKKITFLDTPGHEAFTAMRARGAQVTDIVIIVVAADDNVMPQTKEAINHAQLAGVPMIIAINKIDKDGADPERIRRELSEMNILVEDWGGTFQCQEISAKKGINIDELLEKVLLEAEMLELKANPNRRAVGTVIEASLDKGRGYVTTLLVQNGTLNVGDVLLVGQFFGKVKAMTDHTGKRLKSAGPAIPVQVLGLDGAPQSGDKFNVMELEREAREIANKREQIMREQSIRTKKHITMDEIARRIAIGSFKQLNIIIKGDVDGSVEALSDSLQKLSTPEIDVNILHKAVGQISESDVLLASASDAIIIGFQVRPSVGSRKLAEQEQIEIKLYSIIYDAINDVKDAMEGMHAPTKETILVGSCEIRQVFKISKIGTVAGCMVLEGFIKRNNKVKLTRDGIVVFEGDIDALKRFKDDVSEVKFGYECGLSLKGYNDLREGDIVDSYETREIKRTP